MIGLYYKNFFIGDLRENYNGPSFHLSQHLHDLMITEVGSYGVQKGKVVHVHLYKEGQFTTAEIIQLRKGIAYEHRMEVLSDVDETNLFNQLTDKLGKMRNIIPFFIVADESLDSSIRRVTNKLKIKRKKAIYL